MEPKVRVQFLLPMKVESLMQVITALDEDVDLVQILALSQTPTAAGVRAIEFMSAQRNLSAMKALPICSMSQ
jgi:hypothetical protein